MGTDIHLVAEVWNDDTEAWEFIPGPVKDCWNCGGTGIIDPNSNRNPEWLAEHGGKPCGTCGPDGYYRKTYLYDPVTGEETEALDPLCTLALVPVGKIRQSWFHDRHYDVFAILGNVRNGRGFAGVVTGSGFTPISDNRGLPDDLSAESVAWFEHHGGDHSDSWVDVAEILKYKWDDTVGKTGVLSLSNWKAYRKHGTPQGWSGDVSGGMVRYVDVATMDELLRTHDVPDQGWGFSLLDGTSPYCRLSWTNTVREAIGEGFFKELEQLLQITGKRRARLVFNFDS